MIFCKTKFCNRIFYDILIYFIYEKKTQKTDIIPWPAAPGGPGAGRPPPAPAGAAVEGRIRPRMARGVARVARVVVKHRT